MSLWANCGDCRDLTNIINGHLWGDSPGQKKKLFKQPVVRCFISYQDIVRVTLGHTGIGDSDKLGIFLHIRDRL